MFIYSTANNTRFYHQHAPTEKTPSRGKCGDVFPSNQDRLNLRGGWGPPPAIIITPERPGRGLRPCKRCFR